MCTSLSCVAVLNTTGSNGASSLNVNPSGPGKLVASVLETSTEHLAFQITVHADHLTALILVCTLGLIIFLPSLLS